MIPTCVRHVICGQSLAARLRLSQVTVTSVRHKYIENWKRLYRHDVDTEGQHQQPKVIIPPPSPATPLPGGYDVTHAGWEHVERLLPQELTPAPPEHESYPTPSGWRPPTADMDTSPYYIRRTRFHNYPLFLDYKEDGKMPFTVLKYIDGDIWKLDAELRKLMAKTKPDVTPITQVCEISQKIRLSGNYMEAVNNFLTEKGF